MTHAVVINEMVTSFLKVKKNKKCKAVKGTVESGA